MNRWFSRRAHRSADKSCRDNRSYTHTEFTSTGVFGTSMSARLILGLVGPKGWAVRPLKRYASWVQDVVRQFGPLSAVGVGNLRGLSLVREDRDGHTSGVPVDVPRHSRVATYGRISAESI